MATAADLIAAAETYTHLPYRYGGKGPDAYDCSGLITRALADIGLSFPHGSANQIAATTSLPIAEAITTAGALLYRPGHIAISRGDGTTIEARNPTQGIGNFSAHGREWTRAGTIPALTTERTSGMQNPAAGRVSSEFGKRAPIPGVTTTGFHAGIDIANKTGTPIYAAYAGLVVAAGWNIVRGRSGNGILIENPDGERQYYGHLSRIDVRAGQKVAKGQQIGLMGATGNVTGPHLHFETWNRAGTPVNPRIHFEWHGVTPGVGAPAAPTPAPAPAPAQWPDADLRVDGDLGPDTIRAWQTLMHAIGRYRGAIDGIAGRVTARAMQEWLHSLGHYRGRVDAVFGPLSVKALQSFLRAKGLYTGLLDGKRGPMTVKAEQAYLNQQRHHL
jgi:hypothetical protein